MEKGGLEKIRAEVNEIMKEGGDVQAALKAGGYGIIGEGSLEKTASEAEDFDDLIKKLAATGCAITRIRRDDD